LGRKGKLISVVVASLGLVASITSNINLEVIMSTCSTINVHVDWVMASLAAGFGLLEGPARKTRCEERQDH
jgi:hypothetical protein